ncbi:MAG: hypothetical protein M4579_006411 [Chaenotheca gracillima]|nr:MAG: hypothetical protein M4579_006411 [Chaenotheca gracillima]
MAPSAISLPVTVPLTENKSANSQKRPWRETPLVESTALSRSVGCKVFLKLENLQPSGSFKSRGVGHYMQKRIREHAPDAKVHFYASSGGNAGLACATAAAELSYPATIVVPQSTTPLMISRIRAAGGTVVQEGAIWKDADNYLRENLLKHDPEGVYVPPFDHPDIWEGNSTCIDEVVAQLEALAENGEGGKPDAVVCSVGGGGLYNGIMQGLDRHNYGESVPVLAMETKGADSLSQALEAKELITLPGITSIATSLGATRVTEKTFEYARRPNVQSVVLSDAEAAMGSWRFSDDERILVEPACGVCLALCYDGRLKNLVKNLKPTSRVVIVVCGGSNVSVEKLAGWRTEFGDVEKITNGDKDVPSSHTAPTQ